MRQSPMASRQATPSDAGRQSRPNQSYGALRCRSNRAAARSLRRRVSLPAAGGNVSLVAQCSGGDSVDSWNWAGATYTTTSGNTASATITTTTTFTVSPTNGGGSSTGSVTVNVGNGGGGSDFLQRLPQHQQHLNELGQLGQQRQGYHGSAGRGRAQDHDRPNDEQRVGQFCIPLRCIGSKHDVTLSTSPCDFGTGLTSQFNGGTQRLGFSIGGTSTPILQPNSTYYFNFKNSVNAVAFGR